MDTCIECGAEISPAEGYYNGNVCNACAFGLPEDVCRFGGAQPEHQIGTIEELAHGARMMDEAEETAEWEEEWEQMNDVRDAMESFNEVPSYFERYQDLQANRRFFLSEEEFARDDAHDLAEMIQSEELRMAAK